MGRIATPPMGPYAKWMQSFLDISTRAFDLLETLIQPEIVDRNSLARRVIYDLSLHAEATSIAARVALTYSLSVPAFALARVRLEQCIVASFLIHAPEDEGMSRYLFHIPIQLFKAVQKHEKHFQTDKDLSFLEQRAAEAQQALVGAQFREAKFERHWTQLELSKMAEQRDVIAAAKLGIPWRLEDDYWKFYPLASLAVHSAGDAMLFAGGMHEPELFSGQKYPYTQPDRARALAGAVARYDVIQCAEALARLGIAKLADVLPLIERHDAEIERDA